MRYNKIDGERRKTIRDMYTACGNNASLAARKLGYSEVSGRYWKRIGMFDDIPNICPSCGARFTPKRRSKRYCTECKP